MYESKLVTKCGQFGNIFHFETTEELFVLDKNHCLDPPLLYKNNSKGSVYK